MVNLKKILLSLFLFSIIFVFGCENVDLSKVSDEDLERLSEKAIVCPEKYIRFGTSCCLDQNANNICDRDEKTKTPEEQEIEEEVVVISPQEYEVLTMENDNIVFPNVFLFEGQESIDKQKNRNVFLLTNEEFYNIESANLRFVPYCKYVDNVGILDIEINNKNVFSNVPVCNDAYRQPIPLGVLNEGENNLIFKIDKGGYSVEQIKLEFSNKEEIEVPEKCILAPGLACVSHKLEPTQATLIISNGLGKTIAIDGVWVGDCGKVYTPGLVVRSGQEKTFILNRCEYGEFGEKFKSDILLKFTELQTGLTKTVYGNLETTIEETVIEEEPVIDYPRMDLPTKCTLPAGIACVDFGITQTTASIVIINGMGLDIAIDGIFIGNCGEEYTEGLDMKSGEEKRFDISGCYYGESADKFEGDLEILYTDKTTGLTHVVRGSLETTIE